MSLKSLVSLLSLMSLKKNENRKIVTQTSVVKNKIGKFLKIDLPLI
jgi:hypothetical protein